MLILLITALSLIGGQSQSNKEENLQKYLAQKEVQAREEFNKILLPNYLLPIFKISNRFQGSYTALPNGKFANVPISTTMFDVQLLRYSKSFLIVRLFVETPMVPNSFEDQITNPAIQSLNNTSVGFAIGIGWYYYDSRTADKPTGLTFSNTLLGAWYMGVANSTSPDFDKESNGMFEVNFRLEHFIKKNFAILYGIDFGTVFLTHKNKELDMKYVTTGFMYGAVFGFSF